MAAAGSDQLDLSLRLQRALLSPQPLQALRRQRPTMSSSTTMPSINISVLDDSASREPATLPAPATPVAMTPFPHNFLLDMADEDGPDELDNWLSPFKFIKVATETTVAAKVPPANSAFTLATTPPASHPGGLRVPNAIPWLTPQPQRGRHYHSSAARHACSTSRGLRNHQRRRRQAVAVPRLELPSLIEDDVPTTTVPARVASHMLFVVTADVWERCTGSRPANPFVLCRCQSAHDTSLTLIPLQATSDQTPHSVAVPRADALTLTQWARNHVTTRRQTSSNLQPRPSEGPQANRALPIAAPSHNTDPSKPLIKRRRLPALPAARHKLPSRVSRPAQSTRIIAVAPRNPQTPVATAAQRQRPGSPRPYEAGPSTEITTPTPSASPTIQPNEAKELPHSAQCLGLRLSGRQLQVLREIVATERSYLHELETIVHHFYYQLKSHKTVRQVMSDADMATVFGNTEILALHARNLVADFTTWEGTIKKDLTNGNLASSHDSDADGGLYISSAPIALSLPGLLLRHNEYFKAHEAFCKQQAASGSVVSRLRARHASLHTFLTKLEMASVVKPGLRLQDLMLVPMQRLSRYPLLLEKLLSYTPATSKLGPYVEEALRLALQYLQHTNEEARLEAGDRKIQALVQRVPSCPDLCSWLERIDTQYLDEFAVRISAGKHRRVRGVCYLFSTALLLARPARPLSLLSARRSFGSASSLLSSQAELRPIVHLSLQHVLLLPASLKASHVQWVDMQTGHEVTLETNDEMVANKLRATLSEALSTQGRWRRRRNGVSHDDVTPLSALQAHRAELAAPSLAARQSTEDIVAWATLSQAPSSRATEESPSVTPASTCDLVSSGTASAPEFTTPPPSRNEALLRSRRNKIPTPRVRTPFRESGVAPHPASVSSPLSTILTATSQLAPGVSRSLTPPPVAMRQRSMVVLSRPSGSAGSRPRALSGVFKSKSAENLTTKSGGFQQCFV
ncbi:uncharacterized protein MONBRDRAFT_10682 [Monosiga brevicollis MX1]|uniref:DH domain-containing protein n=1 Tax=Monosiga brevicollis TaxID=81824 RepID=A9V6X5_MONBE|nr:uncharacterized protein MONBRDRAFT_10682 [Monosiga brevicollis MX1]EDQ86620.1 predicted protein [Monosiga brevicollis MX1]|eukprot:XP_001748456.1 hypothetical protein [Monosiga brevicollis MX1]